MSANKLSEIFKIAVAVQASFDRNFDETILSQFILFALKIMRIIGKHQQNCA